MVRRIFLGVLFLLSAAGFSSAAEPRIPDTDKGGEIAQDFTLKDLSGKQVSLSDFKDKPVILFFWSTTCPFCRDELNTLNREYERIKDEGVELFAISVREPGSKVNRFVKNFQPAFPVLLDEDTLVAQLYDIIGVPTYVFIDRGRNIVFRGHRFTEKKYNLLTLKKAHAQ